MFAGEKTKYYLDYRKYHSKFSRDNSLMRELIAFTNFCTEDNLSKGTIGGQSESLCLSMTIILIDDIA